MDGTLLNTLEDIAGGLNQTLRSWGLPEHSPYEALDGIGHGSRYLCQWGSGLDGEELDRFTTEYRYNTVHLAEPKAQPYPGICELLKTLKGLGFRLGIYTNKPQDWTEQLVERFFGLSQFDMITGTRPGGYLKPDPGGILEMCRLWQVSPAETLMIGDSEVDWQTSINAGCPGICVSWGFGDRQKLEAIGVNMVHTADALRDAILNAGDTGIR